MTIRTLTPELLQTMDAYSQAARRLAEEQPPEELFDEQGRLKPELAELAPKGERRMGANPHANGGALLRAQAIHRQIR
jgi:phosphoketolase